MHQHVELLQLKQIGALQPLQTRGWILPWELDGIANDSTSSWWRYLGLCLPSWSNFLLKILKDLNKKWWGKILGKNRLFFFFWFSIKSWSTCHKPQAWDGWRTPWVSYGMALWFQRTVTNYSLGLCHWPQKSSFSFVCGSYWLFFMCQDACTSKSCFSIKFILCPLGWIYS